MGFSNIFFVAPDAEISDPYRRIECIGFVCFWRDSPPGGLIPHSPGF